MKARRAFRACVAGSGATADTVTRARQRPRAVLHRCLTRWLLRGCIQRTSVGESEANEANEAGSSRAVIWLAPCLEHGQISYTRCGAGIAEHFQGQQQQMTMQPASSPASDHQISRCCKGGSIGWRCRLGELCELHAICDNPAQKARFLHEALGFRFLRPIEDEASRTGFMLCCPRSRHIRFPLAGRSDRPARTERDRLDRAGPRCCLPSLLRRRLHKAARA